MHYFICISLSHQANPINVIHYVYKGSLISEGIFKKTSKATESAAEKNWTEYNMPLCLYYEFFGSFYLILHIFI
jgi:hypothetical protein